MNKKALLIIAGSILGVTLTSSILFVTLSQQDEASTKDTAQVITDIDETDNGNDSDSDYTYIPPTTEDGIPSPGITPTEEPEVPFVPATEMDLDPSSITVFVNKEYSLPKNYKPDDLVVPNIYFNLKYYDERTLMRAEAAKALEKLFIAAYQDGYKLCGVSGYRSYERQLKIFTDNILTKGKEHTLQYSAVPGTSEHQTGLAIDVSCESLRFDLNDKFYDTPEGKWLADNAYRFGYIIRYPKGKGDITGYAYEPWHIRYVGKGLAKYLYENDLTLDEYYNYVPSKDFDFEALYAYLINITPTPTVTPTVTPSVTPTIAPSITPSITPTPTVKPGKPGGKVTGTPTPTPPAGDTEVTPTTAPGDDQTGATPGDGSQNNLPTDETGTGVYTPTPVPN